MTFNHDLVQRVLPKLKKDTSLPALIAVKDGVVIAICENLHLFVTSGGNDKNNDETVEPRAVEEWLDRAGILLREVPIAFEDYCRIRPEEDALLANMMREKAKLDATAEEEDHFHQCGVPGCRKRFHHQHVGVKTEEQTGLILCQDIAIGGTS